MTLIMLAVSSQQRSLFFFFSFPLQDIATSLPMTSLYSIPWKRKDCKSAGSDDTASMSKGGGYVPGNPPTDTRNKEISVGQGCVCRGTQTHTLTVVAQVVCHQVCNKIIQTKREST